MQPIWIKAALVLITLLALPGTVAVICAFFGGYALKDLLMKMHGRDPFEQDGEAERVFVNNLESEIDAKNHPQVAALLSASITLLSRTSVARHEAVFLQALASEDKRVTANALDALRHFFPEKEFTEVGDLTKHFDNRISANAIIHSAVVRFDDDLVRILEQRVSGRSVPHKASSLYAIGEIAAHYRAKDPSRLDDKPQFLALFALLPEMLKSSEAMVQKQILVALKKMSDEKLVKEAETICFTSNSAGLRTLFEQVFATPVLKRNRGKAA